MSAKISRRQFLAHTGAACAAASAAPHITQAAPKPLNPRVAIARDDALVRDPTGKNHELLRKLVDAAMQKAAGTDDATAAWKKLFRRNDRIGIKVNTLGLSTNPAVVDAIVDALRHAGIPANNIIIWDRFDVELGRAGYKLNKSAGGVQCRGTDAEHVGSGYERDVETSGSIGSCFSKIVSRQINKLISVPVLKDHNLAGVSVGMKNFFGAIHNPNKYHDHNCDPYITDAVLHPYIRPKWRLTICDGTRAQYHGGPTRHPAYAWPFGGLIVSTDIVAADAVAANLLEQQRQAKNLDSLEAEKRPPKHIATAAAKGLGVADLTKIRRIEV